LATSLGEATVRTQLRAFLNEAFLIDDDFVFEDDTSLFDSGIVDSTGVLELVLFLEENFGVAIADDEIVPEYFDSIDRLCQFLKSRLDHSRSSQLDT